MPSCANWISTSFSLRVQLVHSNWYAASALAVNKCESSSRAGTSFCHALERISLTIPSSELVAFGLRAARSLPTSMAHS